MKLKNFILLAALASIGFASCGGDDDKASGEGTSLRLQVKKACRIQCEAKSLVEKVKNGEDAYAELRKLEDQAKVLVKKYGPDGDASDEDKKAFEEAMNNCDCE